MIAQRIQIPRILSSSCITSHFTTSISRVTAPAAPASFHSSTHQLRPSSSSTPKMTANHVDPQGPQRKIHFGPFEVTSQVFLKTRHSFALVNLKPLLPGHVLVCPLAPHKRLTDLSPAELTDLMTAVQRVQRMLARHYFEKPSASSAAHSAPALVAPSQPGPAPAAPEAGSFNIAIQDGPEAGQTVGHVHVHVIPRIRGTTAKPLDQPTDVLYERMAEEAGNVGGALWDAELAEAEGSAARLRGVGRPVPGGHFPRIEDCDRQARTKQEMEAEAAVFKKVLEDMEIDDQQGPAMGAA